ncbi:hypothetical protein [Oceaniglobus roseus]|uniref:hypothetical protein n=1 Tax=Oceaniglobus roseus TaxID=1737570 RepID=UPI000C7ECC90|nr:hypothetical protein [Kandeliimicrobium roseum]
MSAPNTDPEKQAKRHKPALLGMTAVVIYALILLAALIIWLAWRGNTPEEEGAMIDARTGETVQPSE